MARSQVMIQWSDYWIQIRMEKRRASSIRRRGSRREPKAKFTLFCEGKKTEPEYFSAIKKEWTGALVSIDSRRGVGTPITIAQCALKFAKSQGLAKGSRRRRNLFEENDEVWVVFDRDEHERYEEAVNLCKSNGIGVARSNPCFEVWLILHERDYDRPDDRHQVQRELQRLRPEYDRSGAKTPDCEEMVGRVEDAEARGEVLRRRREGEMKPYGRPSTTVGNLTKAIREADRRVRKAD